MTHALTIARREIEERTFVFAAAVAMALVPLALLLAPHTESADRKGLVVAVGFLIAIGFTWGLAIILGTTLIGRELSEKRLSFYFSRPIGGAAIWFGKLVAATTLLVASFAIVHAIPLGFGATFFREMSTASRGVVAAAVLGIAFALMLMAHVVSTWVRSRSALLAIDFVALVIVKAILAAAILPLIFANSPELAKMLLAFAALMLVIAILGAGAWQLARGRVDVRRSHRELSRFLWSVMIATALAIAAYSAWTFAATPRALHRDIWARQEGNVLSLDGPARGTWMLFAIDVNSGTWQRLNTPPTVARGNTFVSIDPAPTLANALGILGAARRPVRDFVLTVTKFTPSPVVLAKLPFTSRPGSVSVTPDGSRVAWIEGDVLAVYDTAAKKSIAAKLPIGDRAGDTRTQFVGNAVRLYVPVLAETNGWLLHTYDLDLASRSWHEAAAPFVLGGTHYYHLVGTNIVTTPRDGWPWFMRDGRVAVASGYNDRNRRIEIRRGDTVERVIPVPSRDGVYIASEIGSGKLLVTTRSRERTTYIIDANTGATLATMDNVSTSFTSPFADGTANQPRLRALFHRDTGRIEVIDTETGAIRPLL